MFTLTLSLDSLSLYIVVFDILALLTYVLYLFHKKRNLEKSIKSITDFISDYFINTGAEVQVTCYKLAADKRFVVLIQSEPLKRFRYSNILESSLIAHTLKKTGSVVDKIYWRFPVQIQKDVVADEVEIKTEGEDIYFSDVQSLSKAGIEYKVSEASWDDFQSSK
jgi:hypothetical protein